MCSNLIFVSHYIVCTFVITNDDDDDDDDDDDSSNGNTDL